MLEQRSLIVCLRDNDIGALQSIFVQGPGDNFRHTTPCPGGGSRNVLHMGNVEDQTFPMQPTVSRCQSDQWRAPARIHNVGRQFPEQTGNMQVVCSALKSPGTPARLCSHEDSRSCFFRHL
jgi:hypothetical protein